MAYISQDPNQNTESNTTNVLAPTSAPTSQTSQPATSSSQIPTTAPSAGYVSNGNPYGQYAAPSQPQVSAGTSASSRKTTSGPSSGLQTNVQTYAQKNIQSSGKLGEAVSGKLQTTSDIARQNLQSVQKKFGTGVELGSLENRGTALSEAQKAFTEASTAQAPTREWQDRSAAMYAPTKTAEGTYSPEDQALIASNKAKVTFGDGSSQQYETQAEAQSAIDEYNKLNPGFYTYGETPKLSVGEDRLSKILNAQYQGPQELSEIGGYGEAYSKFQDVGQLQKQALSNQSKEQLLKRTFETPTGEYGKGSRLLDDLLLGQGKAAETLRSTAEKLGATPTGKIEDEFKGTVREARGQAAQRTAEMDQLKQSARAALSTTAEGRSGEVNARINDVIKDWEKYPQYFRERFKQELDTHNAASEKNKQYKALESQYGDYDSLANTKKWLDSEYTGLDTIDENQLKKDEETIRYYNDILSRESKGRPDDWLRIRDRQLAMKSAFDAASKNVNNVLNLTKMPTIGIMGDSLPLSEQINNVINLKETYKKANEGIAALEPLKEFKNYDPEALNMKLSQLEAESLGIQGGEGLYNLIKDQGIEGLLKTKAADRQQLVSQQEQSQLARLQSLAELAKDYGVEGSGVNVVNPFQDRSLAGKQTALSALDVDNFKRLMQGAERTFRTDAAGNIVSGTGTGTGSSGGIFGTKRASATKTLSQNFGDLLAKNNAYRNIYSDKGVNKDLLKTASQLASGEQTFGTGAETTNNALSQGLNVYDTIQGMQSGLINKGQDLVGGLASNVVGDQLGSLIGKSVFLPVDIAGRLMSGVSSAIGGSSGEAQARADYAAQQNALAALRANIQNKIQSTGLKNQLTVGQNQAQDLELFKLLGLLDTTSL